MTKSTAICNQGQLGPGKVHSSPDGGMLSDGILIYIHIFNRQMHTYQHLVSHQKWCFNVVRVRRETCIHCRTAERTESVTK